MSNLLRVVVQGIRLKNTHLDYTCWADSRATRYCGTGLPDYAVLEGGQTELFNPRLRYLVEAMNYRDPASVLAMKDLHAGEERIRSLVASRSDRTHVHVVDLVRKKLGLSSVSMVGRVAEFLISIVITDIAQDQLVEGPGLSLALKKHNSLLLQLIQYLKELLESPADHSYVMIVETIKEEIANNLGIQSMRCDQIRGESANIQLVLNSQGTAVIAALSIPSSRISPIQVIHFTGETTLLENIGKDLLWRRVATGGNRDNETYTQFIRELFRFLHDGYLALPEWAISSEVGLGFDLKTPLLPSEANRESSPELLLHARNFFPGYFAARNANMKAVDETDLFPAVPLLMSQPDIDELVLGLLER